MSKCALVDRKKKLRRVAFGGITRGDLSGYQGLGLATNFPPRLTMTGIVAEDPVYPVESRAVASFQLQSTKRGLHVRKGVWT
jgi:hypothetical protein